MDSQELVALLHSIGRIFDGRTNLLIVLLMLAAVIDCRTRRIPNALVICGALFALVYNTMHPPLAHYYYVFPLAGAMVGLLLFLPLYLMRSMGAGDVKLLAMVGAFLGPLETLYAALWTLIAGGVLSVLFVLMQGTARRMFENLSSFVSVGLVSAVGGTPHIHHIAARQSAGKMPYAIVIATGTMASLVSHQFGFL